MDTMIVAASTLTRPLSEYERFFLIPAKQNPFHVCAVAHYDGIIQLKHLHLVLKILQIRHPLLRMHVEEGNVPQFSSENVLEIPIRFLNRLSSNHWERVVNKEIHQPFPIETGPLIKLSCLQGAKGGELILVIDHLIGDGKSAVILLNEVFELLDLLKSGKPLPNLQTLQFHGPIENRVSITPDDLEEYKSSKASQKFSIIEGLGGRTSEKRKTGFIHCPFTTKETELILKRCKSLGITVQSATLSAIAVALGEKIRKNNPEIDQVPIRCHTPVCIRGLLDSKYPASDVGNYFAFLYDEVLVSREEGVYLSNAKFLKSRIKSQVNSQLPKNNLLEILYFMNKIRSEEEYGKQRKIQMPLAASSNLGKIPLYNSGGSISVNKLHFVVALQGLLQSENSFYSTILTGLDSNGREKCTMNFIYPKPLLSAKEASLICLRVKELLISGGSGKD